MCDRRQEDIDGINLFFINFHRNHLNFKVKLLILVGNANKDAISL